MPDVPPDRASARPPAAGAEPAPGLASLFEALPFPAYAIDANDQLIASNGEARALLAQGLSLAGHTCAEVFRCTACGGPCAAHEARRTGEIQRTFWTDIRPEGAAPKRVRMDAAPLDGGGVAIFLRDVADVGEGEPLEPDAQRAKEALRKAAGNVTLAAALLGVHRTTLWRWMNEYGLHRETFRPSET